MGTFLFNIENIHLVYCSKLPSSLNHLSSVVDMPLPVLKINF